MQSQCKKCREVHYNGTMWFWYVQTGHIYLFIIKNRTKQGKVILGINSAFEMYENKTFNLILLFWLLNDGFWNKMLSHQETLKQIQSEN